MRLGIVEVYCGASGKRGYYNNQEIGVAKAMKKYGYEVTVFYPRLDIIIAEEENVEENIKVVYVPAKAIGVHARYDWSILKTYQIEVVQIGSDNQLFAPNMIAYCDRNDILVYSFIGVRESTSKNILKKTLLSLLYWRNIHVYRKHMCFAKTPAIKQELEKYGIKNVVLTPVGLDTDIIPKGNKSKVQLCQIYNIPLNRQILLFVGRMDEYKKPYEAIELLDRTKDIAYLIMIGTGELNDLIAEEIKKRDLKEHVLRIETIPNSEIHTYYQMCDFYLNFNPTEIFGMSVLEAMYHGCTVLAYHAPGPDFIIQDNISGYLVEDILEMENIIRQDAKLNHENIKTRIYEEFVWDKTAQNFDRWIRNEIKTR